MTKSDTVDLPQGGLAETTPSADGRRSFGALPKRFRLPISTVLLVGFGGLVLIAVASVLILGFASATKNTVDLLQQSTNQRLDVIEGHIRGQLDPARRFGLALADEIASGGIDTDNQAQLADFMRGGLNAMPQVMGVQYLKTDLSAFAVGRWFGPEKIVVVDRTQSGPVNEQREHFNFIARIDGQYSYYLIWLAELGETLLNLDLPVRRDGELIGGVSVVISLSRMSDFVEQLRIPGMQEAHAFILYGRDHVLAHPAMQHNPWRPADPNKNTEPFVTPLPTRAELNDHALSLIRDFDINEVLSDDSGEGQFGALPERDPEFVFLGRKLVGYGPEPWIVAQQYRIEDVGTPIARLYRTGTVGLVILLVSVLVALFIGRRITRQIRTLASAANSLRSLDFATAPTIPDSRLRELANAGQAFNAMVSALRWFEMYVPKSLVLRLMGEGESAIVNSAEREVTVMFTDIRGFTPLSQKMSANQVANLLNEHFTLLARCIEAEGGTVDKYIGDSIMAFWGAPEDQADHAARAVRAADAIVREMAADNARRRAGNGVEIKLRIGINSGSAVVGNIGSSSRVNYTLVGETVNVAERLEGLGKTVHKDEDVVVLLSAATADASGLTDELIPLGDHELRGHVGEVTVYRLKTPAM